MNRLTRLFVNMVSPQRRVERATENERNVQENQTDNNSVLIHCHTDTSDAIVCLSESAGLPQPDIHIKSCVSSSIETAEEQNAFYGSCGDAKDKRCGDGLSLMSAQVADPKRYDIFILSSEDELESCTKLAAILVRFCRICHSYTLTIYPALEYGENRIAHLERGLQCSSYKFIFIDDGFEENRLAKFGADAALMQMIQCHDQSIIPVKAHRNIMLPPLLRMFRAIEVCRLLRGKQLREVDVNLMQPTDVDLTIIRNVFRMVKSLGSVTCGSDMQLSTSFPRYRFILRSLYKQVADTMDPDSGLLGELYSKEVLSRRLMESIRAEKTYFDRNEALLNVLQEKSESDFWLFIDALHAVGQSHVANLLLGIDR